MTDAVAKREARRLKLLKNAESRMNRLKNNESTDDSKENNSLNNDSSGSPIDIDQPSQAGSETSSPYNLRNRANKIPSETLDPPSASEDHKPSTVPYQIVDDPEVPSLAEFLATQEAAKARDGNGSGPQASRVAPPKRKLQALPEKHLEYVKIVGLFVTALLSRCCLASQFGVGIFFIGGFFQSMFFPFLVFEVFLSIFVSSYLQSSIATAPSGSLLTTALMLCGIRAELVRTYSRVMAYVTSISNDFFMYIFAFLMFHVVLGSET